MTVEQMREAVRLSDRIEKMERSVELAKEQTRAKISVWTYGKGSVEDLEVPVKDVLRFYRREVRRLKAELAELTA